MTPPPLFEAMGLGRGFQMNKQSESIRLSAQSAPSKDEKEVVG